VKEPNVWRNPVSENSNRVATTELPNLDQWKRSHQSLNSS